VKTKTEIILQNNYCLKICQLRRICCTLHKYRREKHITFLIFLIETRNIVLEV